jgi:hypothetical protein
VYCGCVLVFGAPSFCRNYCTHPRGHTPPQTLKELKLNTVPHFGKYFRESSSNFLGSTNGVFQPRVNLLSSVFELHPNVLNPGSMVATPSPPHRSVQTNTRHLVLYVLEYCTAETGRSEGTPSSAVTPEGALLEKFAVAAVIE